MGLVGKFSNKQVNVPLKEINVSAVTRDTSAIVEVTQKYTNDENERIEAFYSFPMYQDANVVSCVAEFHNGRIDCIVKEKKVAEKEYKEAKDAGKQAALLREYSAEHYDVAIGNLDPSESVKIVIKYLTTLKWDVSKKAYRFTLPTTITPRFDNRTEFNDTGALGAYFSGHITTGTASSVQSRDPRDIMYGKSAEEVRLSLEVSCTVGTGYQSCTILPFSGTETFSETTSTGIKKRFEDLKMDRDFVLFIHTDNNVLADYIMQEKYSDGSYTWKTQLDSSKLTRRDTLKRFEFIFVIDQSGSMRGSQIMHAKSALHILLNSMESGNIFNIFGFGSTFYSFFDKSVDYNEANFKEAKKIMESKIDGNLGGTELNAVMEYIYSQKLTSGFQRRILLLTDGEVWNVESLFKICRREPSTRIYTIGIGNSVSHLLVEGMAKFTGGNCEIVTENELIEEKCVSQMNYAMSEPSEIQIGSMKMRVVPGHLFVDHRVVEESDVVKDTHVSVSTSDNEPDLVLEVITCEEIEGIYPLRLRFIKDQLDDLERQMDAGDESVKQNLIDLSCRYNILTKWTAFVGILEGSRGDVAKKSVVTPLSPGKYSESAFKDNNTFCLTHGSTSIRSFGIKPRAAGGTENLTLYRSASLKRGVGDTIRNIFTGKSSVDNENLATPSTLSVPSVKWSIKIGSHHNHIEALLMSSQNFDGSFSGSFMKSITELEHAVTDTHGLDAKVWYTIVAMVLMLFLSGTIENENVPIKWRSMYAKSETFVQNNGPLDKVSRAIQDAKSLITA